MPLLSYAQRGLALALVLGGVLVAGTGSTACGIADPDNRDYGEPPDPSAFKPPGSRETDGYGSGTGPGAGISTGPTKVACPTELKRCPHTVTYPDGGETSVELRGDFGGPGTWDTGKPMAKKDGAWSVDIDIPLDKAIQYKFFVNGSTWKIDADQPTVTDGSGNTNNTFAGTTCDAPTCEEEGELPPGVFDWRDSVIYFVFVDRFANGNPDLDAACRVPGVSGPASDYLGGDWAGVTQKINEGYFGALGVNTLWITVPFANPKVVGAGIGGDTHEYSAYHGYWPKLDNEDPTVLAQESCFGQSFDDLRGLISAAHQKGLKVLFDFAMVHAHSSSAIFTTHPDWFWPNSKMINGQPSTDCICGGEFCKWEVDPQRCWFASYLPHWNFTKGGGNAPSDHARAWSVANAVAWITQTKDSEGKGVDGFRADAIKHVDVAWLNDLRAKIGTDVTATQSPAQRFYIVGETYDSANRDLIKSFIDPATKLDGQFDFPLRGHLVDAMLLRKAPMSDLATFMDSNDYFYGASAVMSTFVGNHDLPRSIHLAANQPLWNDAWSDGKDRNWDNVPDRVVELEAYERLANAFAVLFTNRGAPLVYYGDEIGLPGAGDPDNRRFMPWDGYTVNQTYLKDRIKKLGDIRSKHPALRRGIRSTINANTDTWTYARITTGDTVYVAINRSDAPKMATGLPAAALDDLIDEQTVTGPTVTIPARQAHIFVAK
jgi:glycosidase